MHHKKRDEIGKQPKLCSTQF